MIDYQATWASNKMHFACAFKTRVRVSRVSKNNWLTSFGHPNTHFQPISKPIVDEILDFRDIIYRNNNYVENLHATSNNENKNIIFTQQFCVPKEVLIVMYSDRVLLLFVVSTHVSDLTKTMFDDDTTKSNETNNTMFLQNPSFVYVVKGRPFLVVLNNNGIWCGTRHGNTCPLSLSPSLLLGPPENGQRKGQQQFRSERHFYKIAWNTIRFVFSV